ncbi:MAG: hypothetical protein AAFV90_14145 [Cyanobacteria bacterium J06634_5]
MPDEQGLEIAGSSQQQTSRNPTLMTNARTHVGDRTDFKGVT